MIDPSQVTAVLVTRGDQPEMVSRILDSLIFDSWVIWDNSQRDDMKTAGRYYALNHFRTHEVIYFQDDDVYVPPETQQRLCEEYEPDVVVANYGHGENPDGYDDLPLVHGGAILDADLPWKGLNRYLEQYPLDRDFLYEADFIAGVLYPAFRHVYLPHEINLPIAQDPSRMCNQPWQRDLKLEITNRARAIRDSALVVA